MLATEKERSFFLISNPLWKSVSFILLICRKFQYSVVRSKDDVFRTDYISCNKIVL